MRCTLSSQQQITAMSLLVASGKGNMNKILLVDENQIDINFQQKCKITTDLVDELSPLAGYHNNSSISSSSSASSFFGLGNDLIRPRSNTIDTSSTYHRILGRAKSSPVGIVSTVPKDSIQPKHGRIDKIHNQNQTSEDRDDTENDDEFFAELHSMRSRSNTCPDGLIRKRRLKALRRPSTPPPPRQLKFDVCKLKGYIDSTCNRMGGIEIAFNHQ